MGDLAVTPEVLGRLKIFPLPTVVLLPGAVLPLHIFEPRYRKMVSDALAGDRVIAMSMLEEGWEGEYAGRPPVRKICGVGRIHEDERLPDGRFNIQLVGVARAEILEELEPSEPYRVVRARFPPEAPLRDPSAVESLRHALVSLCALLPEEPSAGLARASATLTDGGALSDLCVAALATEASMRQKTLEALDLQQRLALALDVVGEAILRLRAEDSSGGQGELKN
jgi:uncharacterized protein